MTRVCSFAPLVATNSRTLILGSVPGAASLAAGEYYAHPRNAFWPIMAECLQFELTAAYHARVAHVLAAGVAVWDVLASCNRPGSADAAIDRASLEANDVAGLLERFQSITRIGFNGAAAEALFRREILPKLNNGVFTYHRLPSTSPAFAALSYEKKRVAWRALLVAAD